MASLNTALVYLLITALNGWLLILWYHYNRCRARTRHHTAVLTLQHDELASSFNAVSQIISEMSRYNLLTVYHNQIGQIIDLKSHASPPSQEESGRTQEQGRRWRPVWVTTPGINRRLL